MLASVRDTPPAGARRADDLWRTRLDVPLCTHHGSLAPGAIPGRHTLWSPGQPERMTSAGGSRGSAMPAPYPGTPGRARPFDRVPTRGHDMQCPTDGATLVMSERSGSEIDYCPTCRGVWLDRGELDKIIDRSLGQPAPPPPQQQQYQQQPYQHQGHDKRKRKKSWLSELFD